MEHRQTDRIVTILTVLVLLLLVATAGLYIKLNIIQNRISDLSSEHSDIQGNIDSVDQDVTSR